MSILKFDNHTLDLPSLKHSYEEDGFLLLRDFASPTETDLLERYAIAARKVRLDELEKQQTNNQNSQLWLSKVCSKIVSG